MSLKTKQRVMQRAASNCPSVTLDVQGKGVPSLMDSGSMVTLIWEGYFEKNILPFLIHLQVSLLKPTCCSGCLQPIMVLCQFQGILRPTYDYTTSWFFHAMCWVPHS